MFKNLTSWVSDLGPFSASLSGQQCVASKYPIPNITDVDEEEREQEQDLLVRNNLFWKNPKASKPFLLKTRPN